MKRTLLFLSIMLLTVVAKANHNTSDLIIRMFNNSPFAVSVDNGPVTAPSGKQVIHNVPAGYRLITVYKKYKPNHVAHVIFSEMVFVPEDVRMKAIINQQHNLRIVDIDPITNQYYPPVPANYSSGNGCTGNYLPLQSSTMCPADFDALLATVNRQNFDDVRSQIALQGIRNAHISSRQVALLMRAFTFESTKLDFAKQAYHYVVDKDKYYIVNNEFIFSSSIDELNKYLFG